MPDISISLRVRSRSLLRFRNNIVPFFLERFPGAAAAYSLRQLHPDAIFAIRVRRSSDNQEMDIGFTFTGELDESALLLFVGGGDGFVVIWYNQSGNNNHASQSVVSAQPKIVNAGVVIKENGKPAIDFDGFNDSLKNNNSGNWQSAFIVCNYTKSTTAFVDFDGLITGLDRRIEDVGIIGDSGKPYFLILSWYENTYLNNTPITLGSSSVIPEINNLSVVSGFSTDAFIGTGLQFGKDRHTDNRFWGGCMSEIILYPSDQSANRFDMNTAILNHYTSP